MIGVSGRASAREPMVCVARATGSSMARTMTSGSFALAIVTASMPWPASPETAKWPRARARLVSARLLTSGSMTTTSRFFGKELPPTIACLELAKERVGQVLREEICLDHMGERRLVRVSEGAQRQPDPAVALRQVDLLGVLRGQGQSDGDGVRHGLRLAVADPL